MKLSPRLILRRRAAGVAPALPAAIMIVTMLVAAALAFVFPAPAAAQGMGWFGNLFSGFPRPPAGAPSYPGYGSNGYAPRATPDQPYDRPRRRAARRPIEQPPREVAKPQPKNAGTFVAVFGDSLGQMLGQGLDEALADRADVAVEQRARSATGLVMDNYYDWPKTIADLLGSRKAPEGKAVEGKAVEGKAVEGKPPEAKAGENKAGDRSPKPAREKIDVAVMMVGTNDHQPLTVEGKVLQPGTAEWTAVYARRVAAIDEMFRARGIPLIWVGVPITKDDAFADAMAGLNDVYREAAAKTGATYVDTWEAFSDDSGNFAAYGPDVNGQTVRLRATDGIHFTKAGARKLAHFVEVHVRHALEAKVSLPQLPTEVSDGKDKDGRDKPGRQLASRPDAGAIRNLNEAPTTTDGVLTTPDVESVQPAKADSTHPDATRPAVAAGDAIPIGRADNARWSGDTRAEP